MSRQEATVFRGYEFEEYESKVIGLFSADGELSSASEGQEIALVAAETPFYAESGGQIGDTGSISAVGASLDVIDTQKVGTDTIVHICRVQEGEIAADAPIRLSIDNIRRKRIRVNHSATHLLHLALREVLGDHARQAGSRVSDRTLRFDFNHSEPVTSSQLEEIEDIVNTYLQENHLVETRVMDLEEATQSGAMALFGEKYADKVRVVQIGERSIELCGGTHASATGELGFFEVISEGSVSSGVRRIEAIAGISAQKRHREQRDILAKVVQHLKTSDRDAVSRVPTFN